MNRAEMVERICVTLLAYEAAAAEATDGAPIYEADHANDLLDAILPQVTTVAELEALDPRCMLMAGRSGVCLRAREALDTGWPGAPTLTVVWQPS